MAYRRFLVLALSGSLLLAACGDDAPSATTTTTTTTSTTTTTTTQPPTTTTTAPPTTTTLDPTLVTIAPEGARSAVNGLPDGGPFDRRALAVKVDNHPNARPQSGIQEADGVIETLVEGGLTRFIAVFHAHDSTYVGPVRSMRPTDTALLPLIGPMAFSGAQPWVLNLAASRGTRMIGETPGSGLFRIASRVAPHNLYGDTTRLRTTATARNFADTEPVWLYELGEWRIPDTPATTVHLSWSRTDGQEVTWRYQDDRYLRWQGGVPHMWRSSDGTTGQIAVDVLVILEGERTLTPAPGGDGVDVPSIATVGTGEAWVISRGGMWHGTWKRNSMTERYELIGDDGAAAVVPPGVVWVSVFPLQRDVTVTAD